MIKIINEKDDATKAAFQRAMKALVEKDADIILVNVDDQLRFIDDEIRNAVCPSSFME